MKQNRGSQWRKWDLHFHTPSSYDYSNNNVTNEDIINSLVNRGIDVVAITDHHVIDINRIKALQAIGAPKGVTVLPGIEFLSDAKGNEPIHFIGIFSEECNIDFIWKQIESKTAISRIEGENKPVNEVYCHLLDTISEVKRLGGLVTIHAGKKSNGIENITNSLPHSIAQKVDIAEAVDVFELGKEKDQTDYSDIVIPFLKNKINKHIPLIICSDNHNIEEYKVKQNLWIKADPTFEGLKQVIYEPEARVKIQANEPDFKDDRLIIDKIRFICSDQKFTTKPIYLNRNLNVIIGGKSSGKSILLYNIANTLLADKNFLEKEGLSNKYNFRGSDSSFNFEVTTAGGFSQLLFRDSTEKSVLPEIKYIPQNYLVKLAEPNQNRKGAALNKIVRDLINEDNESRVIYDDFISLVKSYDRKREIIIERYFQLRDRIGSLRNSLAAKAKKEILEQSIMTNTKKVEELNKSAGLKNEEIALYNELQVKLEMQTSTLAAVVNDFRRINELLGETRESLLLLNDKKNLVRSSLENLQMKEIFDSNYLNLEGIIADLNKFAVMFEIIKDVEGKSKLKIKSPINDLINHIQSEKRGLSDQLLPFNRNEDIKESIRAISDSIMQDKKVLHEIAQLTKELSENEAALSQEKDNLFNLYKDTFAAYEDVIAALKNRTADLENDGLLITGIVKFNFTKFQSKLEDVSDGRSASYNEFDFLFKPVDSLCDFNLEDLLKSIGEMFDSIVEKENYVLNRKADKKTAVKLLLDDYFFDYWQIVYKGDKLGEMSAGKASFVILMLIVGLSKSKSPILIDQPEDNLDNRSISADLVEYLRNKKLERQIILVTHNPNVVVNADAENVIVANQKGQGEILSNSPYQFDYINGSLENSFNKGDDFDGDILESMGIREHIAEIVEGGKEAFKNREKKYGFTNSLVKNG